MFSICVFVLLFHPKWCPGYTYFTMLLCLWSCLCIFIHMKTHNESRLKDTAVLASCSLSNTQQPHEDPTQTTTTPQKLYSKYSALKLELFPTFSSFQRCLCRAVETVIFQVPSWGLAVGFSGVAYSVFSSCLETTQGL